MGQAKRRGAKEQRVADGIAKREAAMRTQLELLRRRPSPKHTQLMAMLAAIATTSYSEVKQK